MSKVQCSSCGYPVLAPLAEHERHIKRTITYDYENGVVDGEKEAVEGIVRWLSRSPLYTDLAAAVLRGEWKEEP